jgi:uncharacterized protein YhhL (DUF1145 family)
MAFSPGWLTAGKVLCVVLYAAAVGHWAGLIPAGVFPLATTLAVVFIVLHALEVPIFWQRVKRYRGPLAVSVVLTLLFGLLHLSPLRGGARPVSP